MDENGLRILLGYDGSDMAFAAVNYIASLLPKKKTEVVLFHVETEIPASFWTMEKDMDFRFSTPDIRAYLTEQHKKINAFMEKARKILLDAGFPDDAVVIKIQAKKYGVARDIIKESQRGYDVVVVGRTGKSRLKDILVGSVPIQLSGKIHGIPLIVVGGKPKGGKILVAFDGSKEIMRAVKCMGKLIAGSNCLVLLCHVLRSNSIFHEGDEKKRQKFEQSPMEPLIKDSIECLIDAGFIPDQISSEVLRARTSLASVVVEKANGDDYDTIVVGRRGLTVIKEFFLGRVGKKIFQLAGDLTVWVVK